MLLVTANIFQPLIDVFESVLKFFHNSIGIPWGWAIVLLTICVRALLVPLTVRQIRSMARMQQLAPEMKAIQAKYKEDKQRQQQEMMKFYKENNVNPLASCLPLAAQLPVFISLYYMLRQSLRLDICPLWQRANNHGVLSAAHTVPCGVHGESSFLFIGDITDKATGATLVVLIILYVGTQLGLQPDDVRGDDGPHAAADHAVHAAAVRDLRHPVPGRRARVLDHHQPVDDRPAVRGQAPDRAGAPGHRRGDHHRPRAAAAARSGGGGPPKSGPNGSGGSGGGLGALIRKPKEPEPEKEPVAAGARGAPPKPPRKKKKRSGRRR